MSIGIDLSLISQKEKSACTRFSTYAKTIYLAICTFGKDFNAVVFDLVPAEIEHFQMGMLQHAFEDCLCGLAAELVPAEIELTHAAVSASHQFLQF